MGYEPYAMSYEGCIASVGILFWVAIAAWIILVVLIYFEAEKLGMDSLMWSLLAFLLPIIGLVAYVIASWSVRSSFAERKRQGYLSQPGIRGEHPQSQGHPPSGSSAPDPGFRDERLEELIDDGRLRDARQYLREMIQLAREMNDMQGIRNYSQYEAKINKAAMDGGRSRRGMD